MRISTRGSYSLEALLIITLQGEGNLISTRHIAKMTGITAGYLEQLFIPLKKAGIISSIRGVQGGYKLAKDKANITVGDIFRAVERDLAADTFAKKTPGSKQPESIKKLWQNIYGVIHSCADSITLSQVAQAYAEVQA